MIEIVQTGSVQTVADLKTVSATLDAYLLEHNLTDLAAVKVRPTIDWKGRLNGWKVEY